MESEAEHNQTANSSSSENMCITTFDIDLDLLKKERLQHVSESPNCSSESQRKNRSSRNNKIEEVSYKNESQGHFHKRHLYEASICSQDSTGSCDSKSSFKHKGATKRRSWKKARDKPKRPLSAYNIFFKHTRSRIVEGLPEEATAEETIASIEAIVAKSTETRKRRKTHWQISFVDLARTIAERWKAMDKQQRAVFDHYAAIDMKRYRRDVSVWKAKKEKKNLVASSDESSRTSNQQCSHSLEDSFSSTSTLRSFSDFAIGAGENYDEWNTPQQRALGLGSNSFDSEKDFDLEPLPIDYPQRPQNRMVDLSIPPYFEQISNGIGTSSNEMNSYFKHALDSGDGWYMNSSYYHIQNENVRGILMKNQELDQSAKQLKQELSRTNFSIVAWIKSRQLERSINKMKREIAVTKFSLWKKNNIMNKSNTSDTRNHQQDFHGGSTIINFSSLPMGPSVNRMKQLYHRRLLKGDFLPPFSNNFYQRDSQRMKTHRSHKRFDCIETAPFTDKNVAFLDPVDMNPITFDEIFRSSDSEEELITNLGHLDFLDNGRGSC